MDAASSSPPKSNSGTPRLSVDRTGSPHFHGLHLPFRSPPNPSQAETHELSPATGKIVRRKAVREAKLFLRNTVRDDWQWPATGPAFTGDAIVREPLGYAMRIEGASDLEDNESETAKRRCNAKTHNPYQFETPDAVGASVNERKRKRLRLVQEEMLWNEGLRTWAAQRDAWTHAMAERPAKPTTMSSQPQEPDRFLSTPNASEAPLLPTQWPLPALTPASDSPTSTSSELNGELNASSDHTGPWLPIFSPLLSSENPVRANVKPAAYDHIYSKVVIQQLTPSVPIPLTHMTQVLVEGWKADGAWPPQSREQVPEPSSRRSTVMNMIKMRRAHGMGHHRKKASIEEDQGTVKKGIGVVKKAFGVGDERDFGIEFENGEMEHEMWESQNLNSGLFDSGRPSLQ